jgi:hypothetical protein
MRDLVAVALLSSGLEDKASYDFAKKAALYYR